MKLFGPDQLQLVAPVAAPVKLNVLPAQIGFGLALALAAAGTVFTVTVVLAVAVHPLPLVTVKVYAPAIPVVALAETVGLCEVLE